MSSYKIILKTTSLYAGLRVITILLNIGLSKIIASYKCKITENDTAETLFEKVECLAIKMFKYSFDKIINNNKFDYLQPDKESFFYDINSNDLEIPYGIPFEEVYDFIRAWSFKGRPKPYFNFNGVKIHLSLK